LREVERRLGLHARKSNKKNKHRHGHS
jgi:hypothetical protein